MRTPAGKRQVVETPARKVPAGAQLYGGPYDGSAVVRTVRRGETVVLLLGDGSEHRLRYAAQVAWLHPAGRKARA